MPPAIRKRALPSPRPATVGRLLFVLAAAALAAATAAASLARHSWAFDLFSHFRLQYLVLAAALIPAALALRARAVAVVLGVLVAANAWAVKDVWLGGEAAGAGLPVRVASINVWGPKNPTPEKLLDFARDLLGAGLQQARGLCDWTQLASGAAMAALASLVQKSIL